MKPLHLFLISLLILGCSKAREREQPPEGFLLRNVLLTSSADPTDILIQDSKIKLIQSGIEHSGEEMDCSGLTALPGFIDTHVHLGFFPPTELLSGGITTVRDLGWEPTLAFGWVKDSKQPEWGPAVLAAGPMLTADGGYPLKAGWAPPGTGKVYQSGMLRELRDSGSCIIKVTLEPRAGPTLSEVALTQLVAEADQLQMDVVAHVSTLPELKKALHAGVRQFAHFLFDDSEIPPDLLDEMIEKQVVVIPTLRANPSPTRIDNLKRFHAAGGKVVYGTDLGNGGRAGIDLTELRLMQQAGMSPQEILDSATVVAAELLGLSDRGVLEAGAVADLVVVKGNPFQDWDALAKPVLVVREGVVVMNRL